MKIPLFFDTEFVDIKTGRLTPFGRNLINQLLDQLQKNASDEGIVMPSLSSDNIVNLSKSVDGTIVYDSTNNVYKGKQNGVFRTIQTT
ncbi:hypothetical protein HGB13_00285 [bacterium]|nr:hypothetical protein [bacterium]